MQLDRVSEQTPSTSAPVSVRGKTKTQRLITKLSRRFRAGRDKILKDIIISERELVEGRFRILDLGGRADYWQRLGFEFLDRFDIEVICINQTEAELCTDGIRHPRLSTAVGDACNLVDYPNLSFNMVHSNSVIEHVGNFASKRAFAMEVSRLAPAYYVQTPYAWFPVDPHWPKLPMFHWLPLSLRYKLLCRFSLGWGGRYSNVDHAMQDLEGTILLDLHQMNSLFGDAIIRRERLLGLTKSLIAERRSTRKSSAKTVHDWHERIEERAFA